MINESENMEYNSRSMIYRNALTGLDDLSIKKHKAKKRTSRIERRNEKQRKLNKRVGRQRTGIVMRRPWKLGGVPHGGTWKKG